MNTEKVKEAATNQAAALGLGAALGALTKHATKPQPNCPGALALQVGSAVGAAAASGASVPTALGAGAAIITAKVAVVTAAGAAAAPFVALAGLGYGIYWLFKKPE